MAYDVSRKHLQTIDYIVALKQSGMSIKWRWTYNRFKDPFYIVQISRVSSVDKAYTALSLSLLCMYK
jgi:hypothetical protein